MLGSTTNNELKEDEGEKENGRLDVSENDGIHSPCPMSAK